MASSFLNVTPVSAGQNNKEITINDADLAIEFATQAVLSVDMSGGNVTLTVDQFTRNAVFTFTGTTADRDLIIPSDVGGGANTARRVFYVKNSSGFIVTVKVSGQAGVPVTAGASGVLSLDGTDAVLVFLTSDAANALDWKASVRATTIAAGTLATSFANGSVIDGVTLATGDRILIKDQAAGAENGLYTVNASGAPTRSSDADTSAEVTPGLAVVVEEGTINADTLFILTTNGTIVLDTTALTFAGLSGGSGPNNNFAATTDPTVNDDDNQTAPGPYGVGSEWVNVTLNTSYICVDSTNGAAIWNQIDLGASTIQPFVTETGDRTIGLTDAGKLIRMTKATPGSLIIPLNATAAFALGTFIHMRSAGVGQMAVSPNSGVTLNSPETFKALKQYSQVTLMKVATDEWDLNGDLELGSPPANAAPVVESQTLVVQETLTNSITIAVPSGVVAGNLLITHIGWGVSGANTFVTPTGWIELIGNDYGNASGVLYYRIADGTEPADYTFTKTSTGNTGAVGAMLRISNVRAVVPISYYDEIGSTFNNTAHAVPRAFSTFTNALDLSFAASAGGGLTYTPPTSMTEIYDHANVATTVDRASASGASQNLAAVTFGPDHWFTTSSGTPDRIGFTVVVENLAAPAIDISVGHRYWRFQGLIANGNTEMAAQECQFLLSGVDQTGSGTASASSGIAANAFDNDTGTVWTSTTPWELTYDFGSAQIIDAFSWQHGGSAGRGPWTFAIQYSDDNTNWVTAKMFVKNTTWVAGEIRTFTL